MKTKKPYEQMTTWELLGAYLISRLPRGKEKLVKEQEKFNEPPQNISINHIAVVLDDNVEEVLRCENRLAALLLSNPEFVDFDPEENYPKVGLTKYVEGKFINPEITESILSEKKIESLLDNLRDSNE